MTISTQKWHGSEILTLEWLSERYETPKYRVSPGNYEPGTWFTGVSRSGLVFVLEGSCQFAFDKSIAQLSAGEFADLPSGSYRFDVVGKRSVELVRVWNIEQILSEAFL